MEFKVYRNFYAPGLRKVFVELWDKGELKDTTRMFGYLLQLSFCARLAVRKWRMVRLYQQMQLGSGVVKLRK